MAVTIAYQRGYQVVLRSELFGVDFDVPIEPPPEGAGNFDGAKQTIESAHVSAYALSSRLGLPVVDLTLERVS